MSAFEVLGIAVGLSLDAFAVSVASGAVVRERRVRHALRAAFFFGGFQAAMPLLGWALGIGVSRLIAGWGPWIAFGVLAGIGTKMVVEAMRLRPAERRTRPLAGSALLVLAVATSLDALAVGFTLALPSLQVAVVPTIIVIGLVTFVLSLAGFFVGDRVGHLFESEIEIVGGLVLVGIGVAILLRHLS